MTSKNMTDFSAEKVIEIKELDKAFGSYQVLEGANLDLYKGENLVVLGKSGTGKSVLIKIIVGLLRPDSGLVNVLGQKVDEISYQELLDLRLRIGFSFQNSALYDSMTVRDNLEFPLVRNRKDLTKSEVNALIEEMLDAVGLAQTINQMPSELSGGQRKRIGIARTLILKPEIMLYDEPTAGLDPITSKEINKLINDVQERYHTSAIIITHDLTCAKEVGNRVAMLMERRFERQGSFEQIFNSGDQLAQPFFDYNFIQ
ncbi:MULTISPECIES: ABC transporter ATP-binding protein [unclassified Pedobacter]|uniref:ABC transporter ATP-binding protein n=1 Tax=Pedobacter TaxID=84567 RepID=UPI000B4B4F52|nr:MULTISPECIES: ATP-binding cassette domain-containing protein [unclassified Pedobacter]MCX2430595.1 ATP-binding cassette domain-containing protein [Pedobacter sp. GR22-10]MCX2586511.1 ATP-binding cassette domain-containing protein [Pedobacter sp. MR22-3]OWK69925.1 ABC transporter ATP-binding protein [Pedobacter sp. AJM]